MGHPNRRRFVSGISTASTMAAFVGPNGWIRSAVANELQLPPGSVRFSDDIEPLVRWLETTPKEKVVAGFVEKIQSGIPYYHLLASVFLAGIRNVQPRPSVGFKFHTVLVVHAAHQASLAASNRYRWLPLLWAADYFKRAQDDDAKQGDWTMQSPANIEKQIGAGPFIGGEKISVADLKIFVVLGLYLKGGVDHVPATVFDGSPKVVAVHNAVKAHPAVQAWYAQKH